MLKNWPLSGKSYMTGGIGYIIKIMTSILIMDYFLKMLDTIIHILTSI